MPPSPPLCKYLMPRRRAAALPRINEKKSFKYAIISDIFPTFAGTKSLSVFYYAEWIYKSRGSSLQAWL